MGRQVTGNWINNGTFTAGTGSITFRGGSGGTLAGSSATTFYNLVVNNSATANTLTSTTKAFTVNNNLTVTQGNLILTATDANYSIAKDLTVGTGGILTHSVNWDAPPNLSLNISGSIFIDGIFNYTTRSTVRMISTTAQTLRTGSNPAMS